MTTGTQLECGLLEARLTALLGRGLMTREGVALGRFHRLTGLDFYDLMDCGVIHKADIIHTAYTMAHGQALVRG